MVARLQQLFRKIAPKLSARIARLFKREKPQAQKSTAMSIPVLTYAAYDSDKLYAEWSAEIPPRFTGFQVAIAEIGGDTQTYSTTTTTLSQEMTLLASETYTITIITMVQDQPDSTSEATTLITAAPTLMSVAYAESPTVLSLNWMDAMGKGATAIEGYLATLTELGKNTWNSSSSGSSTSFDQSLSTSETYTCVVRGSNSTGNVLGPMSTVYNPIVGAPTVSKVVYDENPSSLLQVTWSAAQGGGVQSYLAILEELGKNKWNESTADLHVSFTQVLSTTESYTISVIATDSSGVVTGPPSVIYQPICVAPEITMASYTSSNLTVNWNTATGEGVEAYVATLEEVGSNVWYSPTTDLTTEFNQELSSSSSYNISVRASNNDQIVLGPASEVLHPLLTSPESFSMIYDGTELITNWVNDTNPVTTAYIVELDKDGSTEDQNTPIAAPSKFEQTLANGSVYQSKIRSTGDKLQGPWSDPVFAPYAESITYTYDDLNRLQTAIWNTSSTVTYTIDDPGNILSRTTSNS